MNLITSLFFIQLFVFLGIFLAKLWNVFNFGQWYDIRMAFILLLGAIFAWFLGILSLMNLPTMLILSQLFRMQSWLYYFIFILFLAEVFFAFVPKLNATKQYKSNEQKE